MNRSAEVLLSEAKSGRLSRSDLNSIAANLERGGSAADTYTLLHALGHAGDASYAPVVERYLESPNDPLLAWLALQILCGYWGIAEQYRDHLLRFIHGVTWDVLQGRNVQQLAATDAGELAARSGDREIISALHRLALDITVGDVTRDAAYTGLLLARGATRRDLPSFARIHGRATYDPTVLRWAARVVEGG